LLDLSAGQIVAEKYRIDDVIGVGGMGVVLAATHIELDQRVAIKMLRDASPEAVARFRREARLIVRLKSAHVARVFDIGVLDDDTPYIVMELLDGEDLARRVGKGNRVAVEQAVDWVLEACEAIAEAHALGMVHRDLKPANLFLARGPGGTETVKVLDFGISKSLDERDGTGLTNEGMALGSPGYMSPEQMTSSRDVDVRSDVYSIGAILYRLTSGQSPYKGESFMNVLAAMADGPPPSLGTVVPDAPPEFIAIVDRCLAHDPAQRPANLAELADALAPFGSRAARSSAERIAATLGVRAPSGPSLSRSHPASSSPTTAASPAFSVPVAAAATPPLGPATLPLSTAPPPTRALEVTVSSPLTPRTAAVDPGGIPGLPPSSDAMWPAHPAPMPGHVAPGRKPVGASHRQAILGALALLALLAGTLAWASFRSVPTEAVAEPQAPPQPSAPLPLPATAAPPATLLSTSVVTPPATAPIPVTAVAPAVTDTPPRPPTKRPRPAETAASRSKPPRPPSQNTSSQSTRRPSDPSAPPSPTDVPPSRH